MCGLFGIIGKPNKDHFTILALMNEARGKDSAGVFNGKDILKGALTVTDLLPQLTPDFFDSSFVVGHTRQATHGANTDANAHPFCFTPMVGAHNGIISNYRELNLREDKNFPVDSQIMFYLLAKKGFQSLSSVEGSIAFWLWEKTLPDSIRLARNSGNPLYYATTADSTYFSSIEEAIGLVLNDAKIEQVRPHTILRFEGQRLVQTKEVAVGTRVWWSGSYRYEEKEGVIKGELMVGTPSYDYARNRRLLEGASSGHSYLDDDDYSYLGYDPQDDIDYRIEGLVDSELERITQDWPPVYRCGCCKEYFQIGVEEVHDPSEICPYCDCADTTTDYITPSETLTECICGRSSCVCCHQAEAYAKLRDQLTEYYKQNLYHGKEVNNEEQIQSGIPVGRGCGRENEDSGSAGRGDSSEVRPAEEQRCAPVLGECQFD